MTVLRDEQFTQSTTKSSIDQGDTYKVYCELRPGQCVFLVHVPELRRFQGEAQKTLGDLAWKAAREVLETGGITNQPIRLAVGIRGNIAYERVILGRFVPGSGQANLLPPEVEEGFGCERRLIEWFTPVDTNPGSAVEAEAKKTAP